MAKVKKVVPQVEIEESEESSSGVSGPVSGENGDKHYDSSTRAKWGEGVPPVHEQMRMVREQAMESERHDKSRGKG